MNALFHKCSIVSWHCVFAWDLNMLRLHVDGVLSLLPIAANCLVNEEGPAGKGNILFNVF